MDTTNVQGSPEVAFGGGVYLVVWEDLREGNPNIYAQRVTPQGQVLDPQGIQVSFVDSGAVVPGVAFDGTNFLVTWENLMGDAISAARVSPSAAVLDSPGICLNKMLLYSYYYPTVAFNGTDYLVAWQSGDRTAILGTRFTPSGEVLDSVPLPLARIPGGGYTEGLALSSDHQNFLLAWTENDSTSNYRIYGTMIRADGRSLDTSGTPMGDPGIGQSYPILSWDGMHYLCAWCDQRNIPIGDTSDIYAVFLDTLGHPGVEGSIKPPVAVRFPFSARPNPFVSFASVPGHSFERFVLYDISGRKIGTYQGDRIGEGLTAGVYFLRKEGKEGVPVRVVKVR